MVWGCTNASLFCGQRIYPHAFLTCPKIPAGIKTPPTKWLGDINMSALLIFTGSEPTAACGGRKEAREWLRSTDAKVLRHRRQMSGTATGQSPGNYRQRTCAYLLCSGWPRVRAPPVADSARAQRVSRSKFRERKRTENFGHRNQKQVNPPVLIHNKNSPNQVVGGYKYVRITYFHGQSPGNYRQRTCA